MFIMTIMSRKYLQTSWKALYWIFIRTFYFSTSWANSPCKGAVCLQC